MPSQNYEHPTIEIEDSGVVIIEMLGGAIGTLNYTVNSYQKIWKDPSPFLAKKVRLKLRSIP